MPIELSVSSARAKRRVMNALRALGYDVRSGAVRIAHPFSVVVEQADDVALVRRIVRAADAESTSIPSGTLAS